MPHPSLEQPWASAALCVACGVSLACPGIPPHAEPSDHEPTGSATTGSTDPTATTAGPATTSATSSSGNADGTSGDDGTTAAASTTDASDPGSPLTVLSLNLHCFRLDGTSYASNADRFGAIASLAAVRQVDVLALQEACARPGETAIDALRAALEDETGAAWTSTWALAHVAWEGTPDEADEGVGLLVRGTLSDPAVLEHAVQGPLRRVAVSATLPSQLGGVRVTSVHFEVLEPGARTMQAREVAVAALVDTDDTFSAIVAGDFNDVEGSPTHAAFPAMGYLAADAGLDPAGIDHVMIHRAASLRPAAVEEVLIGPQAVSDHPGILVRFEPADGDAVSVTRITAMIDPEIDGFVTLRGDTAPLSWRLGFPLRRIAPGEHTLVTTELAATFEYKLLVDDTVWQTGPNLVGDAGADHVVMPVF